MENASKALVMAGGVLIGVMLMSLAVYLFISLGGETARVYDRNAEQQIVAFNTEYTQYEGREDITIYDIVSIANKAIENNQYYEVENNYTDTNECIKVMLNNENYAVRTKIKNINFTSYYESEIDSSGNTISKLKNYTCKSIKYGPSGKVKIINFQ